MAIESLNTRQEMNTTNLMRSFILSKPAGKINEIVEKESDTILERLLSDSGIGIWRLEPDSGNIHLCPGAKSCFNIASGKEPTLHDIFKELNKEQRALLIKSFENVCKVNGTTEHEVKLLNKNGNTIWLRITGKLYQGTADRATGFLAGTVVDITGQKMMEQKREDCIALLSHELRSPLTTVRLYLQRVIGADKNNSDNPVAEMLKKADLQVNSMLRLMDSLLHVSMLSNSGLELFYEEFNMISLVNDVVNEMQLRFPRYTFALEFEGPVLVKADKDKIIQVLINYIGNAVKYSAEGSQVTVKCIKSARSIIVSVKDQGMGINPADQGNLFERYYRTANSGKKGCGLGLYLVKEIINLHKGDVWLDSTPGKGSAFYFSLPQNSLNKALKN